MADEKKAKVRMADEKKARVRFTENRTGLGYDFKAGEVYELPLSSCKRWIRRNVASFVDIGDMETSTVPHEAKQPSPKYYKGADGTVKEEKSTEKVPDLIPLDETDEGKQKAVKRVKSAKDN